MRTKLEDQATESEKFKLPMQLKMEDIETHRNSNGIIFSGGNFFDGYREKVKQVVLD